MMNDRDNRHMSCGACRPSRPERPAPPWHGQHEHGCHEHCGEMHHCGENAMSMKLFCGGAGCARRDITPAAPPVTVVNPWNCRERAVVYLGIDECGNLVVNVRRDRC